MVTRGSLEGERVWFRSISSLGCVGSFTPCCYKSQTYGFFSPCQFGFPLVSVDSSSRGFPCVSQWFPRSWTLEVNGAIQFTVIPDVNQFTTRPRAVFSRGIVTARAPQKADYHYIMTQQHPPIMKCECSHLVVYDFVGCAYFFKRMTARCYCIALHRYVDDER